MTMRNRPDSAPDGSALRTVATIAAATAVAATARGAVRSRRDGRDRDEEARGEPGRGRDATTPSEVPARGWWDIAKRVVQQVGEDRILSVAAGVTFYALLALFPAIAAFVSIYGLFADPGTIQGHLALLAGILPEGALTVIRDQVQRIASSGNGTLGYAFLGGLAVSLWSANAGMKAVFDALNVAYDEEEKRSFVALTLQSLLFTFLAMLFMMFAIAAIVVLPIVLDYVGLGRVGELLLSIGRWPLLFAGVVFALACLYRYGPSRDRARWRWVTWGSAIAAILWLAGSALFSWYAANFGSYNETYGSLGAVIGFMTWMWLSTTAVLIGAEINAETEHQTARDTTDGPPRPLGARGATMADTVGPAQD
ncbi:YihY/virulence factor BrkB family protein [Prosthecomicrobium sp. N25]|uniref:YihY/virulence factor BrkB family protein n=1 Tax=Prosthecomicrobium sp. N25 TaxID=3129254 RepID=UPI00307874B0